MYAEWTYNEINYDTSDIVNDFSTPLGTKTQKALGEWTNGMFMLDPHHLSGYLKAAFFVMEKPRTLKLYLAD